MPGRCGPSRSGRRATWTGWPSTAGWTARWRRPRPPTGSPACSGRAGAPSIRTEDAGAVAVSAEKGYSREAGNLIFHVSLLLALVLIAGGKLLSYQGSIVTTEGTGFCNRPISYDTFHAGRWVSAGQLADFCIDNLNSFTASYRADGSPQQFRADVSYSRGLDRGQPARRDHGQPPAADGRRPGLPDQPRLLADRDGDPAGQGADHRHRGVPAARTSTTPARARSPSPDGTARPATTSA